jgi:predicted PurR-regulated permease PerM
MLDDRRLSLLLFRVLCYLILIVLSWSVLSRLSLVLTPVAVALVLAFLLNPSVEALEKRRVPRWLAVGVMLLIMLGLLTAVGLTIPYLVKSEIERFSAQLPSYQGLIDRKVLPLLGKLFKYRATSIGDWLKLLTAQLTDWVRGAMGQISDALGTAILSVAGLFKYLVAMLLVPVFAVSFLMDMPTIGQNLRVLIPPRHQQLVGDIMDDIYGALGSWLRGQLTVMIIQAALYSIGLSIAGIPLAIFIGCTAGLLAFVPYVGVMVGLIRGAAGGTARGFDRWCHAAVGSAGDVWRRAAAGCAGDYASRRRWSDRTIGSWRHFCALARWQSARLRGSAAGSAGRRCDQGLVASAQSRLHWHRFLPRRRGHCLRSRAP